VGRGVKLIYYMQKRIIAGDVRHRFTVMGKADIAMGIYDAVQRHTSQLEQVHFLPVRARHGMIGIWQTDKGDLLIPPELLKDWS
jgi:hypothetical protein